MRIVALLSIFALVGVVLPTTAGAEEEPDQAASTPEVAGIFGDDITEDDLKGAAGDDGADYVGYGDPDPGEDVAGAAKAPNPAAPAPVAGDKGDDAVADGAQSEPAAPAVTATTFDTDEAGIREAIANGTASLLVTVRTDLEGANAGTTKDSVLSSLPDGIASASTDLENFPILIVPASEAVLDLLLDNDLVAAIEADIAYPLLLDEVGGVIGTDEMRAAGARGDGADGNTVPDGMVAVLDTGVDYEHAAHDVTHATCFSRGADGLTGAGDCPNGLSSQIGGQAGQECSYNVSDCRHGTHVAGIVAGDGTGSPGDIGSGSELNIFAVQVFSNFGVNGALSWQSDQLAALNDIITRNAGLNSNIHTANMSLGGGRYFDQASCDAANASMKTAIDTLRAANVLTVIAAGNNGWTDSMSSPGCISTAVTVGATNDIDGFASFTNSDTGLDFWAPGVNVVSTVPGGTNAYASFNGTSMATPAVAGALALIRTECTTGVDTQRSMSSIESRFKATGVERTRSGVTADRIDMFNVTSGWNANDILAGAEEYSTTVGNSTTDPLEWNTCSHAQDGNEPGETTMWYEFTPGNTGTVSVTTDANFDSQLRMYVGPDNAVNFNQLTFLGFNDDGGVGNNPLITAPVNGGSHYYFQVDGFAAASGNFTTTWSMTAPPTCNGVPATHIADTTVATFYTGANQVVVGNHLAQNVNLGAGNDVFCGLGGNDQADGGDGVDIMYGNDDNDIMIGGPGVRRDFMYGGPGNDSMSGQDGDDLVYGNAGLDSLFGGNGVDRMYGGPDNDIMRGEAGNDFMYGTSGNDTMLGGTGNDRVEGQAGNDVIRGESGFDDLRGGTGDDLMYGGSDSDNMYGQPGNDEMYGDGGNDNMFGWTGNDEMSGGDGNDIIRGQSQDDTLMGDAGVDTITGASGADKIDGGAGSPDNCNFGSGIDVNLGGCEIISNLP